MTSNNIINFSEYRTPVDLPAALMSCKTWLVWRLVQMPGEKKPRKVPYYINGATRSKDIAQGSPEDIAQLVSFERAAAAVQKGGYSGVGLAMVARNGIVALDFDDCVIDGVILPEVAALIKGTYSEYSPSGTGIRAFFTGSIPRDRKDHNEKKKHSFPVEFFHASQYVTVTGNRTEDCEFFDYQIQPLTPEVEALYKQRFGSAALLAGSPAGDASGDDGEGLDWFAEVASKIGLSIEKARHLLGAMNPDCGYQEWLNTGQSLHHEFDGSDEALALWKAWSKGSEKKPSEKYPGDRALEAKWASFGRYVGPPITGAFLLRHSKDARVLQKYEAVGEWKRQVEECEDEMHLREKLCPSISKDERLTDLERESIAQLLQDVFKRFGTKLTIGFCRKLVAPPERLVPTVKTKRPLTEFGNCDRMLDRYADSLMYVPETDSWYCWSGVYWRKATSTDIEHYAKETIRALVSEAEEHEAELAEFFDFCKISQQAKMVRNMVSLASSDPRVMVPAAELDKHKGLLCVQNGVVDLRTGQLLAPDPAYRMTRVCACNYVAGAKAPLFMKVLGDVFYDDEEMVRFFLQLVGYSIVGDPVEDVMVIPYGNGSNGKSTVFGTIRKVLGSYARSAEPGTFVSDSGGKSSGGGPREDIVRLQGTRFVYVAEPDEGSELREGAIKGMTGGDAIPARAMYARQSIEVEPTWVPFMPTNHKPVVKGADNGIWRRLVLIPFTRNFDNDPLIEKDKQMGEKLAAEAEGVLALLVSAAGAYLASGLSYPASVRLAREQYRSQMDLLSEWIEERCEVNPEHSCKSGDLWKSWEAWAKERGLLRYVPSSIALGRRLEQRFPSEKGGGGQRLRTGIRLRQLDVNADDWSGDFFQS